MHSYNFANCQKSATGTTTEGVALLYLLPRTPQSASDNYAYDEDRDGDNDGDGDDGYDSVNGPASQL